MINHVNTEQTGPARLPKPCTFCKGLGHLAFGCTKKPKTPLNRTGRIRRVGKIGQKLLDQRKAYFEDNPGNEHYCYYCVYVGIERVLTQQEAQIEHFRSKARHPELRFERSNLIISCAEHNKLKGSKDGPEFLEELGEANGRIT